MSETEPTIEDLRQQFHRTISQAVTDLIDLKYRVFEAVDLLDVALAQGIEDPLLTEDFEQALLENACRD